MVKPRSLVLGLLVCLAAGSASASTVLGLSVEDQARLARLIAIGEVVSLQGIDHSEHGIETAVTLRVTDMLKGRIAGSTVVFHLRGGIVGGEVSHPVGEADLKVGQTVLVFIEDVDGRLYNLGLSAGVWNVQQDGGVTLGFSRALTDGLEVVGDQAIESGPIAYSDMASRVNWAASHPEFDHPMLRARVAQGR